MSSEDSKPKSLMSRNKGDNRVITGGRSIKYWQKTSWGSSISSFATWLSNPDQALNPPELSEDERPKAKKAMFKHGPRVTDHKKRPLKGSARAVDDALDKSPRGFGHSRGGSGQGHQRGGRNFQQREHHHPGGPALPPPVNPAAGAASQMMVLQLGSSPPP